MCDDDVFGNQAIGSTERQFLKECQSSVCQQSYVDGFLKVAYQQRSSTIVETIPNKKIADITDRTNNNGAVDQCQLKKMQLVNMQLNAYNYF